MALNQSPPRRVFEELGLLHSALMLMQDIECANMVLTLDIATLGGQNAITLDEWTEISRDAGIAPRLEANLGYLTPYISHGKPWDAGEDVPERYRVTDAGHKAAEVIKRLAGMI